MQQNFLFAGLQCASGLSCLFVLKWRWKLLGLSTVGLGTLQMPVPGNRELVGTNPSSHWRPHSLIAAHCSGVKSRMSSSMAGGTTSWDGQISVFLVMIFVYSGV
ncbi:hypothetical protein CSC70_08630 [Pseudoxanthomonas kalamensis DSM 18571]|nr:hypothetical protein CSC70_08630 [Pseudoxanthomonas kalamensis DSM 18571]